MQKLRFWRRVPDSPQSRQFKGMVVRASVERRNSTLRQRVCHLIRKTLSFSKSDEMHELYLRLFIYNYNLSLIK